MFVVIFVQSQLCIKYKFWDAHFSPPNFPFIKEIKLTKDCIKCDSRQTNPSQRKQEK